MLDHVYWRPLNSRTRFELRFNARIRKKINKRGKLQCTFFSPEKVVQLFLLKEVKPSPDDKVI